MYNKNVGAGNVMEKIAALGISSLSAIWFNLRETENIFFVIQITMANIFLGGFLNYIEF